MAWLYKVLDYKVKELSRATHIIDKNTKEKVAIKTEYYGDIDAVLREHVYEDVYDVESNDDSLDTYKDVLNNREMQYINYRFKDDKTVKEISKELGVSYTNTTTIWSTIKKKIMKKFFKS